MCFTLEEIYDGDILKIKGEDCEGNGEVWYAEKVGITGEHLLVCYIEPTEIHNVWRFEEVHRDLPIEAVLEVYSSRNEITNLLDQREYRKGWKEFGFRLLDENTLYKMNNITNNTSVWIGEFDTSSESSGSDAHSSDNEFVENDEDEENWKSELNSMVKSLRQSRINQNGTVKG